MRCPFCAEDTRDDASVCRYCGNALRIPDALIAENAELKQQVLDLQDELERLHSRRARRRASRPSSESPGR